MNLRSRTTIQRIFMQLHTLLVAAAFIAFGQPSARGADASDWPSYNRTLTSARFSPLDTITTKNGICALSTRWNISLSNSGGIADPSA